MKDTQDTNGHPTDRLPEYVRGTAADELEIERLIADSDEARRDVAILTALAADDVEPMSAAERQYAFRQFQNARSTSSWLSIAWKVAAAIAFIVTGFGVWRVAGSTNGAEWSPGLAIEGWQADLDDLQPAATDVMVALGYGLEGSAEWEQMDSVDPDELVGPWEEER